MNNWINYVGLIGKLIQNREHTHEMNTSRFETISLWWKLSLLASSSLFVFFRSMFSSWAKYVAKIDIDNAQLINVDVEHFYYRSLRLSLARSLTSRPILLLLLRYIDNFICVYYFLSLQFYSVWLLYLFDTFVSLVCIAQGLATKNGNMCVFWILRAIGNLSVEQKMLCSIKMDLMDKPTNVSLYMPVPLFVRCCFFVSGCGCH